MTEVGQAKGNYSSWKLSEASNRGKKFESISVGAMVAIFYDRNYWIFLRFDAFDDVILTYMRAGQRIILSLKALGSSRSFLGIPFSLYAQGKNSFFGMHAMECTRFVVFSRSILSKWISFFSNEREPVD